MDNVRLAFIQLALRAADLPENLAQAKFILWLRSSGLAAKVDDVLKWQKRELSREVLSLKLSLPLAEALLNADPKYANAANAQAAIRAPFPDNASPTMSRRRVSCCASFISRSIPICAAGWTMRNPTRDQSTLAR
jgi:hypothetical protein